MGWISCFLDCFFLSCYLPCMRVSNGPLLQAVLRVWNLECLVCFRFRDSCEGPMVDNMPSAKFASGIYLLRN
jgi:hypothetical protein